MEAKTATVLFTGQPQPLGGLSNEDELAKACPDEFRSDNPWSDYAMKIFFEGGSTANWKWKSDDKAERNRQIGCFQSVLGTFSLPHEDKEAVAGWMLSEILTEVPEHIPG